MFKDMVLLLEAAEVFKNANAEGEKWEKNNPKTPTEEKDAQNPDQTQGEQHSGDATMDNSQGEQPPTQKISNVEQAPPIPEYGNKENALVIHASMEKSLELKEMKRLVDLKAEKEKSEQSLKKILNPATIRARAQKMVDYKVNSSKETTMRITRGNDPLNLTVYERFRLKTLGFTERLEVHALMSKTKSKSNYLLLQSLKAKFQWVLSQAKALGIPPPLELSTFGVSINDKKRKRSSEILNEQSQTYVKYIVKEVEDYLKTYSSAGMDIRWYVEEIRWGFKDSQMWQYSNYLVTL
ncbi:hypothetical protein Tco_0321007 [Tanacetum coccineum]